MDFIIFYCITKDICKYLPEIHRTSHYMWTFNFWHSDFFQLQSHFLCLGFQICPTASKYFPDIKWLIFYFQPACLQLVHIQHIIYKLQKITCCHFHFFMAFFQSFWIIPVFLFNIQHTHDAIDRSPDIQLLLICQLFLLIIINNLRHIQHFCYGFCRNFLLRDK